ncbi:AAA family ATPase [Sorangium sp. So ce131]|uniref:AAA family ATPase n=1 Tax=Sorangium sp. So ce131 TaxID=3133282 RepID=UPI003F600ED1
MDQLGQYTITAEIHESAETLLYHGYRNADRAPVTVKLLKDENPTAKAVAKLRHEHAILRDIHLPGVVRPYTLEEHGSGWALVLEDAGGEPLHHVLRSRRLDLTTALRIASSVADTLAGLHQHRIIHKDIKPHNILVRWEPLTTKLIDFGIAARLTREAQRAAHPDALEGSLAYMSPEQTGRTNRLLDHRTDLYSLGVTLYEMLTGVLPFQTTDPVDLIHCHIARHPPAPHEVEPRVPRAVSDLVMKLLAKAAEDRYQSARGLKADLDECLARLSATDSVAPFPLGQHDRGGELHIPQKLYGREEESARLAAAWERASRGAAELVLIAGYSGVGKSALVNELSGPVVRSGGYFIAGKFDQLSRSTPYAAVAHAFRELVRRLLVEPADVLARSRQRLLRALGPSGQVLIDLIPELELVIGPQPPVPALAPVESQNRFHLLFQAFLRVFTAGERPLALFLDDLQWADPASLDLFRLLLSEPSRRHLLVLGAYRDQEVDAAHPLRAVLGDLAQAGARVSEIHLAPLSLGDVGRLIAESLGCGEEQVAELAAIVQGKTDGNPFFLGQFLESIHQDSLLTFDAPRGAWVWDAERIQRAAGTDDVISFMAGKIQRLSPGAQRVLTLAACVGHEFDLRTLSLICERPPAEAAAELGEALREGLVVPLTGQHRLLGAPAEPGADEAPLVSTRDVRYRFLHDRVQQAAYALVEEGRRQEVHLSIGRRLLADSGGSPTEDDLFDVAGHLNRGAARIVARAERIAVARLNLAAGRKAKAAIAYQAAATYLKAGLSLLDDASWADEYALAFALHAELAECVFMAGARGDAEALFDAALGRAAGAADRAHIHHLRLLLHTMAGDHEEALRAGWRALEPFGVSVSEGREAWPAAAAAELAEVRANLAGRRPMELLDLGAIADPAERSALQILVDMTPSAFFASPGVFAFIVAKQINVTLRSGHSELSAYACTLYGLILSGGDQYEEAYEFGRLGLALCERFPAVQVECKVLTVLASTLGSFREPLRATLPGAARALEASLQAGDLLYASYAAQHHFFNRLGAGDELGALRKEASEQLALMQRLKNPTAAAIFLLAGQLVASLLGQTAGRDSLSGDGFDEAAFAATLDRPENAFVACWYYTAKLLLAVLYGDYEGAARLAAKAEEKTPGDAFYFTADVRFYASLARAMAGEGRGTEGAAALARDRQKLAALAGSCPETFLHKQLLVEAVLARAAGDELAALDLLDQAIEAARQSGFVHQQALASELAGKLHLARGRARTAALHLSEAHGLYLRWGAVAKAQALRDAHPSLLLVSAGALRGAGAVDVSALGAVTATTTGKGGEALDRATVIRAAQAISGEIVLEKVLERVMRIVIENAGAQRGLLILAREGRLMVEASITVDPDVMTVGPPIPVESRDDLALSVVHYVERTREPLVLGDAAREPRFAGDPYVARARPRSLLCVAMAHQGKLSGLVYLENNAATDVFTPARIELASVLASQAAIAVENALLVARVQAATEELRRANEALEDQIALRTEELRQANEQLVRELGDRRQAEAERAELQEEIIRAQRARLSELSTPLIPITERIVVMPLIGTVDEARARQVLEAALEGAQSRGAAVVILDITGVKVVDSGVACSLMNTAAALRLLGTRVVLTGVRPDVARTLVELDLGLGSIVTKGTLQSGIHYALRLSGEATLFQGQGSAQIKQ